MFSGVRADEEAEAEKDAGYDLAAPAVAFDEFFESFLVGEVAEEHAVDCLHLEGFYFLISTRGANFGPRIELTGVLCGVLVEVEVHAEVDGHAESELAKHCCADKDINQHRCLEQRK